MTSDPAESGHWPSRRSPVLDWLSTGVVDQPLLDPLFADLCRKLRAHGLPLDRATLHLRILHPQFGGATIRWIAEPDELQVTTVDREVWRNRRYLESPLRPLYEGEVDGIRARLDLPQPPGAPVFAIYDELRALGIVDYVVLPMEFVSGTRHACTWSTRQAGGFTTDDLKVIADLLPVLAMAAEIRLTRRITRNLLDTYVGRRSGQRILEGQIDRGSGETLSAAIWHCDLRGFTMLSERQPRDDVIQSLNAYFDAMAEPLTRQGGEILKFIGDAMLAIFPMAEPRACQRALRAALEAQEGMVRLNEERRAAGEAELGFGLALHVGDVMWGNIGAQERLDFTVIGPAVNVATRLEELSKELRRPLLVSAAFAGSCACADLTLDRLGDYALRGVEHQITILAPKPDALERLRAAEAALPPA